MLMTSFSYTILVKKGEGDIFIEGTLSMDYSMRDDKLYCTGTEKLSLSNMPESKHGDRVNLCTKGTLSTQLLHDSSRWRV